MHQMIQFLYKIKFPSFYQLDQQKQVSQMYQAPKKNSTLRTQNYATCLNLILFYNNIFLLKIPTQDNIYPSYYTSYKVSNLILVKPHKNSRLLQYLCIHYKSCSSQIFYTTKTNQINQLNQARTIPALIPYVFKSQISPPTSPERASYLYFSFCLRLYHLQNPSIQQYFYQNTANNILTNSKTALSQLCQSTHNQIFWFEQNFVWQSKTYTLQNLGLKLHPT
eukprot:TRINITY_DN33021_c0_g1_i4.p1 TRINITY_DN33021_c0_g1~~TRINITY_DN33021_c0_g1_i4.p1  ORF type:complete len:222 (+),score=-20.55 TRINITY_DN33021_c0_g1_i4:176-841(+)